jgi:hypothetical protein
VLVVDPAHPDASLLALGADWNAAVDAYSEIYGHGGKEAGGSTKKAVETAEDCAEMREAFLSDIGISILSLQAKTPEGLAFKCRVLAYCRGNTAQSALESARHALSNGWLSDMTAVDSIVSDVLSLGAPSAFGR